MGRSSNQRAELKTKRLASIFNSKTRCPHEVIYLRGEDTTGSFGDSLDEAIECFGGLGALDEDIFDSPSDKIAFQNLFNPDIDTVTFGDEDFGFQVNRGKAISD